MPELPEVQVVINYLNKNVLNKKIIKIDVFLKKLFKNISAKDFIKKVTDKYFVDIKRKGKYLIFILNDNSVIVSHLRMEGKYNYEEKLNLLKHDHIIYTFEDGSILKYNDSRQFGTINYYKNVEEAYSSKELSKLGLEPFSDEFNVDNIYSKFKKSNKKLKTFLLDQTNIAGIGNIYANEICFYTRLHPNSVCSKLSKNDVQKIIEATNYILGESIKHNGTTIHTFTFSKWDIGNYQDKLLIHEKKECPICKNKIKRYEVNGRGTYSCNKCQIIKK